MNYHVRNLTPLLAVVLAVYATHHPQHASICLFATFALALGYVGKYLFSNRV